MGFEAPGTGNKLSFAGTKYEGLEVTVDSIPLGVALAAGADYAEADAAYKAGNVAGALPVIDRLLRQFGEALESWNVEKRGEPVPPTYEGLLTLDGTFAMDLISAWQAGTVSAVSVDEDSDLGKGSPSGGTSPEVLAAMAASSSALPSLPPQRL